MLAICGGVTWVVITEYNSTNSYYFLDIFMLIGIYFSAVPYYVALYQAHKLLGYIDTNQAFSELSVKALKIISFCALIVFIICTAGGLPFFYQVSQIEDAPGFMIIGMAIAGIAFVISVFASVLKRLLLDAIEAKNENDLTI
ncbi:MAG: DUF2975 domain-containing protein [Eubacteriales bacterium]